LTDHTIAQRYRLHILKAFQASGVSQRAFCRRPGSPSRKTLASYRRSWQAGGDIALVSRKPRRCPTNRTCLEDEARILAYARDHSGHGAQRIANQLADQIRVGHNGVQGVLCRHGISRRRDRQEWARVELGQVVSKTELETAREAAKTRHVSAPRPGTVWGQDTFLIGRLKNLGNIYHYLAVDIASSFAVVKIYPARKAQHACDFLEHHLMPKAGRAGVQALLQDNGTEYTAARWRNERRECRHPFHHLASRLGVQLRFIKPGHAWTNGSAERLHQTLLHEFYIPAFCKKIYGSIEALDYDLQLYLHWYNHQRTHQGFRVQGRTPAQVFLTKPIPSRTSNRLVA
jgi:transposase InsO family protein